MTQNPLFMSIRMLSEWISRREISPIELTEFFLNRLEKLSRRYNAVVTVARKHALEQARRVEREIVSGNYKGPFHGIPYGAKDLLATSGGIPTTWGAAPFRDRTFDFDATVIRKLDKVGAVLMAKLAMVELAGGMGYRQPNASFTGPGINPWDVTTWSGGSSSGPGSAVSAGLIPFAIGSETWGSILSPANNCGVTGLRPTYGRVSRYGAMSLSWTLDKIGPLCLAADDCGLILEAIAGGDPKDPSTSNRKYRYEAKASKRRFKLGVLKHVTDGVDEEVAKNFEEALAVLGQIARIEEIVFSDFPYEEIIRIIFFAESSSAFDEFIEDGKVAELTATEDRYLPYARTAILAKDYIRALRVRGRIARDIDGVMRPFDAVVGPSRPTPATPITELIPSVIGGVVKDAMGAVGNMLGSPAISVPSGFTKKGLPTGIQFMGRPYEENRIIAVAHAYQSLTDWHLRHPTDLL